MYFSYVLLRGTVGINSKLEFINLGISDPIAYLNNLNLENMNLDLANCFNYQNYSPNGGRMYFTEDNALKIDLVRTQIENWYEASMINAEEYFYLLACLIEAVPFVSNRTGVNGGAINVESLLYFVEELKAGRISYLDLFKMYNNDEICV